MRLDRYCGVLPLALVVVLGLAVTSARAQDTAQAGVVYTMSDDDIERGLRSMGFDYEHDADGQFSFQLSGYKVLLLNNEYCAQLYAGFTVDTDLGTINEWNKNKRFSRAYLKDGDVACLEWEMDYEEGVAPESLEVFIKTFRMSVKDFATHVGF